MPKATKIVGNIVKIPPNMAAGGWDFDVERILEFCKHFGIKWDISFRYSAGNGTVGSHRVKRIDGGGFYHAITLNQYRDETYSLTTLLHELCHAIQAESEMVGENPVHFYSRDSGAYSLENRRHGYRNSRYEIEARDFAENNRDEWNLLY